MTKIDPHLHELAREASLDCMCQKTRKAARLVTKAYDEALRPLGLRGTQFTMLAAATSTDGGVSLTELADLLGMDRTTLSRNLKPLERDGLIELSDSELAGRSRTVRPTPKGLKKFSESEPHWRRVQEKIATALPDREINVLAANLKTLATVMN